MRYEDWPEVLNREIETARNREFAWGMFDCALWAADVVLAMTGVDYAAPFRGAYTDRASAARALRQIGDGGLSATATALLGDPIDIRFAQRGDVVLAMTPAGDALGICCGRHCAFTGPTGLSMLNAGDCQRAWRID